jgi:hypothetical protein
VEPVQSAVSDDLVRPSFRMEHKFPRPLVRALVAAAVVFACAGPPARAAMIDEIQVYTDDINAPGEFGLELHVNTTLKGRSTPDFPNEITPQHGLRFTPEFSYGLTRDLEAGLYLPYARDAEGTTHFAGPKLRLKWLPLQPNENGQRWFMGANLEYAWVTPEFEQSHYAIELRPIVGYRDREWLLAVNPILGWAPAGPDRNSKPDFSPSVKLARNVAAGLALGVEYYAELGKVNNILPRSEQAHTLYLALDYERKPWAFNVGIGRGLNSATDRWTLKMIIEIPIDW